MFLMDRFGERLRLLTWWEPIPPGYRAVAMPGGPFSVGGGLLGDRSNALALRRFLSQESRRDPSRLSDQEVAREVRSLGCWNQASHAWQDENPRSSSPGSRRIGKRRRRKEPQLPRSRRAGSWQSNGATMTKSRFTARRLPSSWRAGPRLRARSTARDGPGWRTSLPSPGACASGRTPAPGSGPTSGAISSTGRPVARPAPTSW